jgi:flagellar FliL protein
MSKSSEPAAEGAAAGGKKKSPLILIIVGVLVLALGGGGAAWFFLGKKGGEHKTAEAKPKHEAPPVFVTLEPFVVNLAGDAQHYLQVGIDLRVVDPHVPDKIKQHLPEIRNAVLLLLSSKTVEDLASMEQKNRLRAEIRAAVNKPLGIRTPLPPKPKKPAETAGGEGEAHAAEPGKEETKAEEHEEPAAEDEHKDEGVMEVLLTSFVIQ